MDLVDRLYRKLRDTAGRLQPAAAAPSFTVAELYQQLIPYRGIRVELGVLELAEYEHALLRLLSGERGYLHLDPPQVREELRRELASPSPILGIYRDFAELRVELSLHPDTATVPERPRPSPPPPSPPVAGPAPVKPAAPEVAAPSPVVCSACQGPLPTEADLRFCPHCGASQQPPPCAHCGLELKPDWNFCIRCGTARPGGPRSP